MPTLSSNAPGTHPGRDSAEADRERLLSLEVKSGYYRYRDNGADFAQPESPFGSTEVVELIDSANITMGVEDAESGHKPEGRSGDGWARNLAFVRAISFFFLRVGWIHHELLG
jgi:hypothetical protein